MDLGEFLFNKSGRCFGVGFVIPLLTSGVAANIAATRKRSLTKAVELASNVERKKLRRERGIAVAPGFRDLSE